MNTTFEDMSCFDIDEYEEICRDKQQQEISTMNELTQELHDGEIQSEFPTIERFLKETKRNLLQGIMNLFPGIAVREHDFQTATRLGECFGFMRALYGAEKKIESEVIAKSFARSFEFAACELVQSPIISDWLKVPSQILLIGDDGTTMGFSFVLMHLAKEKTEATRMIRPLDKYSSAWEAPYMESFHGGILFHGQSYGWSMHT